MQALQYTRAAQLPAILAQRIVILDGAMGFPRGEACPRCAAPSVATVPGSCAVCTLPHVRATHLARSYHHLLPVPPYVVAGALVPGALCAGCGAGLTAGAQCPLCQGVFCFACDTYIHAHLHVCPSCP